MAIDEHCVVVQTTQNYSETVQKCVSSDLVLCLLTQEGCFAESGIYAAYNQHIILGQFYSEVQFKDMKGSKVQMVQKK